MAIRIRRGTTPTVNVTVPMDLTGYTCYLSIGREKFEKVSICNTQMEMTVGEDETTLAFTFTQQQTLSLVKGMMQMQLRMVKDSVALASGMVDVEILEVIRDGEINSGS